jgi:hypothetical protein
MMKRFQAWLSYSPCAATQRSAGGEGACTLCCVALSEWLEAHPGQLPTSELDALPAAAPVLAAAAAAAETFNAAAATSPSDIEIHEVRPGSYCSPRHRISLNSITSTGTQCGG